MIPQSWIEIAHIMVREREKGMSRNAEPASIAALSPDDGIGRIAALRRQVGAAVVRAGERIQGVKRPEAVADLPHGASFAPHANRAP